MFSVGGREVTIDAAGTIMWRATELNEGTLYLPQQTVDEERIVGLLTSACFDTMLDEGNHAQIFLPPADQPDDVVIKEYHSYVPNRGGLPDVRINVLSEAGLAAVSQSHPHWHFRGVRILGAFVQEHTRQGKRGSKPTRWVMERVVTVAKTVDQLNPKDRTAFYTDQCPSPAYDDTHPLPSFTSMKMLFDRALRQSIGDPTILEHASYTHDLGITNILIERLPEGVDRSRKRAQRKGTVVKIDGNAYTGFDY